MTVRAKAFADTQAQHCHDYIPLILAVSGFSSIQIV